MKIKSVSSVLDVIESNNIDVSKDLEKDEKTLASIKEILQNEKEKNKNKNKNTN